MQLPVVSSAPVAWPNDESALAARRAEGPLRAAQSAAPTATATATAA